MIFSKKIELFILIETQSPPLVEGDIVHSDEKFWH